ncbi:MAG: tetratricopeptide repeat protein [Acidobacteria bacterium]|nr:tetratricopeptide repeat protein [Acidobacteriota bacterium]
MLTARAQDSSNSDQPPPPPAAQKPTAQSQLTGATETPEVSRYKREQAYAKLLAGQRLLWKVRNGEVEGAAAAATIRQAQTALQEATQLNPDLAEAYTAQAEITLYYPPHNVEEAVRLATAAVKANRNNFGGHQILARIYSLRSGLSSQQLDKPTAERALTELREVARLAPNDAEAWATQGELYLALERTDEAINALTHWAASPAAVNSAFFQTITGGRELTQDAAAARLGEVLLRAGRTREAVTAIRRALALNPQNGSYEELLSRAIEAMSNGDAEAAIAELKSMVAADPQSATAPILLARRQARAGRVDDAVQTLRAAISRHPESDKENIMVLRLALAQTNADALRYAGAIAIYEEVLKAQGIADNASVTDDNSKRLGVELLRRIIALYKSAEKPNEAIATVERMRRLLGNEDPTIELEHIQLLRDLGKRREALQAAQAARQRFPQQPEFMLLEAVTLTDLGRVDEGIALLRSQLSEGGKAGQVETASLQDVELYLRISALYSQAGRGTEAVEAARKAIALAPAERPDLNTAGLISLSSAQERAGDVKGAEDSLRQVLAKDPDNATALNNLGYFLVEHNDRLNEALEMIQRAVKAEPTNPSFLDSLGWAYFKLGQFDMAERNLADAARRDTSSATIQEHLGDVYQKQGKTEQARAAWQKSLQFVKEDQQAARIKSKLGGNRK